MFASSCEDMDLGVRHVVIAFVFVVGAIGNIAALWILYKSSRTRNRKHVLMLRFLATNDLIAGIGMLSIIYIQKFKLIPTYWCCVLFVILRAFGIGSGCVAFVMALERWMALTRPFLYQQIITFRVVKTLLFSFWCTGALITYMPLFGFGLYYDNKCCSRYKDATKSSDQVYAYMFFGFGTCLCLCIAYCNLTVMWELSRIREQGRVLVRRVSRSIIQNRAAVTYQTPEEVAFAKLMAIICIIFIVCWGPQMILIPLAQFWPESKFSIIFGNIANILMCAYFTLDPYVYVLQRYKGTSHIDNQPLHEKWWKKLPFCRWKRSSLSTLPTTRTASTVVGTPTSVLLNPPSFTIPADM